MGLPASITAKLLPHQHEPAARLLGLLASGQNCADLSDTGTGKTYVALAAALTLNRPTLAIVPRVAMTAWQQVAEYLGGEISVVNYEMLRTGRTPFGWWDNPPPTRRTDFYHVCENCLQVVAADSRPCYCRTDGLHCLATKRKPWRYGQFHFARGVGCLLFDEAHRCGALDSLNADIMLAAGRDRVPSLLMSATAACSPLQLKAPGYLLGLHKGADFERWAGRYGCRRLPRLGLKWLVGEERQHDIMEDIRAHIIPARGVRVTTASIPDFPACTISADLYDIEEGRAIDRLYAEMAAAVAELDRTTKDDTAPDHPLTKILRARQKIELLKVPLAVELAEDYRAKGCSVAIFANFRQTLEELSRRLNCDLIIDGTPRSLANRDQYVARFQDNTADRILVNSQAGGQALGLHDLHGGHPRVGLMFPSYSATQTRQVFGRLPRAGGKTPVLYRVMFAAGTVEVPMHRALRAKLNNLDSLNDADVRPECLHLSKVNAAEILG